LLLALLLATPPVAQHFPVARFHVAASDLCVTAGKIGALPAHRLSIDAANFHAALNRETPQDVEARFIYLGPASDEDHLSSGPVRRQIGFELLAADPCNKVYVSWRVEPESKIVVAVKNNPGLHVHSQCGARGVTAVEPALSIPLPPVRLGAPVSHTLRAELSGTEMKVWADSVVVWQGTLPSEAASLHGPVGIHCDNAKLEMMLTTAPPRRDAPLLPCPSGR
jgi:hypothetical protein